MDLKVIIANSFLDGIFTKHLLCKTNFVLVRQFHIEDLISEVMLPCVLEHLDIVLKHVLWKHAVAQILGLVLHAQDSLSIVSEDFILLSVSK